MTSTPKVALITGAAKRLGAASATALHTAGCNVVVHYHRSESEAKHLVASFNAKRPNSAVCISTELGAQSQAVWCVKNALRPWGRLDVVVNNASSFFPTPIDEVTEGGANDLISSNFLAPLFITQAAKESLLESQGCIINMVDIHAMAPYHNHSVYCAAKAALIMLTRSMANELAPQVRVNAIAPGAILWPEDGSMDMEEVQRKVSAIPLGRCGTPDDIAQLVVYLASDKARFITGEIIKVDGGSSS